MNHSACIINVWGYTEIFPNYSHHVIKLLGYEAIQNRKENSSIAVRFRDVNRYDIQDVTIRIQLKI